MSGAGEAAVEQTDVGSYFIANYPPAKQRLRTWQEGLTPDSAQHKVNELVLPEGRRP